jgi:hypothetical protein
VDTVENITGGVAGVAGFFGPIGAGIAGLLTGGLTLWRKVKPKLVAARTEAQLANAAGQALVDAIEAFKTDHPEQWDSFGRLISDQLTRQNVDPLVIENVIRGLRGLEPKEAA